MSTSNKSMKSIFGAFILTSASLFGGAAVALANTDNAQQVEVIQAHKSFAETNQIQAKQILFIDSAVADAKTLLKGLDPAVEVLLLDEGQGLERIAARLEGRHGIDAIHLISHGEPGALLLGASRVDQNSLAGYSDELARIGAALSADGDILLFGCNVAQGEQGELFVAALAEATSADVAASNDQTGSSTLGGNWVLENSYGTIESDIVLSSAETAGYGHLLATFGFETGTTGSALATVTETVSGITLTITDAFSDFDVIAGGGYAGTSGNVVVGGNQTTNLTTFTFSSAVDLTSFRFANQGTVINYTFTPTGGTGNSAVPATSSSSGADITLDWTGITSFTVTENGGDGIFTDTVFDTLIFSPAIPDPTVTDGNISITSTGTGTGGAYKIGDTVTASWDNTASGNNNATPTSVTMDFSAFGGGAAVATSNTAETYTASYAIVAGAVDAASLNVSVTADATTTADTTNLTLDSIAPTVTDAKVSISGGSGTGGAYLPGDTITATWNNTAGGDNNTDTISDVTVDFSAFGGGTAVTASNSAESWSATYTLTAGAIDTVNTNVSVTATDNAGNTTTTADTTNATVDTTAPTVTDANISISGASGTGGAYIIGDTVTASWDNTGTGENNTDTISGVTVDFSAFGGGASVAASNSADTWTATFTIVAGAVDGTNKNVSVTATDNAGNTATAADTTGATVDSIAPTVTDGNISISGASGTAGAYKVGDTVTATWNNTGTGDNNTDISGVTVNFTQFGGGTAVVASNSGGSWTATFTITEDGGGSIDATNLNVSVTATDNAANSTTTADATNATVDNDSPILTDANISLSTGSGTSGAFIVGDTITATWNDTAGDNNTDIIASMTVDFSAFGGSAVAASNAAGIWTASFNITEAGGGSIDTTNLNVSATVIDNAGNSTTTADSSNATLDNTSPSGVTGTLAVDENSANTTPVGTVSGGGTDGISYSLFDDAGGRFVINSGSGAVTVANGTLLNHEANDSHNITVRATDNAGNTTDTVLAVTINDVNELPTVNLDLDNSSGAGGNDFNTTFAAEGAAVTIADIDAALADVDVGDTVDSLTVTITNVQDVGLESLALNAAATTAAAGLTVTPGTTLTVTGSATPTTYQSILRGVVYNNTAASGAITTAPARVVTAIAADGGGNSLTATANITVVAAPVVDLNGGGAGNDLAGAYSEGDGVTLEAVLATVVEPEAQNLDQLLITLTNPLDGGLESITLAGRANTDVVNGITITYTSSSLITLTGSATDANYQLLLQELQYSNTSEDPDTTARTITAQGRDITAAVGAVATLTLSMTVVNDQPVFTGLDGVPGFTENGTDVTLDSNVTVADFELDAATDYSGATLTLSRNGGASTNDVFAVTTGGFATETTNAGGTLVLTFTTATAANVATVMQSITYSNASEAPAASAQIDWSFNDGNSGAQGTGGALVATGSTTVSITAVNDAPVLSAAPTPVIASIIEDVLPGNNLGSTVASMVVDGSVSDVDAAPVEAVAIIGTDSANGLWQYSTDNGASWNTLTGASTASARLLDAVNKVRFVPNANWFGTSSLSFVAWDQSTGAVGGTADVTTRGTTTAYSLVSDVAGITVTAVNDAPIITSDGGGANAAINSAENQTAVTAMVASDVEGDTRSYSLTGGADQGLFNVTTGGVLTFKNAPDFETKADAGANGVYDVQVTVTDNGVGPLTDVQDIAVTVTNINEAPTISGAPSTLTPVDTLLFSFTPTVDDVDAGTVFTYSIDNTPSWAIFNTTTGELTGIPAFADIGEVTNIIITVSDGLLSDSLPVFTLTVSKNNTAPTISGIADPEVGENTNYSFVPASDDINNDTLVFSITNKPIWATFDTATGGLSGVPGNANIGSYNNIVINVDDGLSNVDLAAFSILVFADLDGDEISDATDPDIDGDGMTNVYEDANGLDKRDASDRDTDLDGDGVSNYDELVAGSNANVDDSLPVVTPQADVTVDAVGLFTLVDIGTATAFDSTDGELIPTSDAPSHFAPGAHIVTWSATDAAGNTGTATQLVNVNPMVNLSNDQIAAEGSAISFSIILNGDAVSYPVSVPYTVSGTASTDGSDHDLFDGVAIINSGTETAVSFVTVDDGAGEGSENIIITLGAPINAVVGNASTQTIEIVEGNVAPMVSLSADQGTGSTLTVTQSDGVVSISSTIVDSNVGDSHSYDWSLSDNALVDVDGTDSTFTFDPLSVNPGFYTLNLSVNDGTDSTVSSISLTVLAAAPVLTTEDSDGDGTNDQTEGYDDSDGDGIADYLDSIVTINVLPAQFGEDQLYLIETLPGLSLTLGNIALQSGNAQAAILMVDVINAGGITDNTNFIHDTGLFDIVVTGVALGQAVNVVIPQLAVVPANAIYRNLTSAGWQTFISDTDNLIFSAAGVEGYCPPPGDAAYQLGLTEGDLCVQLTIIDGGSSDADGVVNNRVAIIGGVTQPVDGGGGGGGSLQPLWLILLLGLLMQQRKLISQKRTES